jgi:hypothetical protein
MSEHTSVQITHADLMLFVDRALDGMLRIVEELGDEAVNFRPDFPDANSPYGILTHCIGVVNHWIGNVIADRGIPRDRPAEFVATGTFADLKEAVRACRARLAADLVIVDGLDSPASPPPSRYRPAGGPAEWTQGAVLIHMYEELAQHHGQMELTRDILLY